MNNKQALILCLMLLSCGLLKAQIIYVKANGTGDGQSWNAASGNLQQALQAASAGTQIWVAEGTYYPTSCTSCNEQDKYQSFEIPDAVELYGGFAGTETSLVERSPEAHPTILSGDIDLDGTAANNSYNIVYTRYVSAATKVDGFTIRGGNATDENSPWGSRGNSGAAWINIGSLRGNQSNPSIVNCQFEDNFAIGFGGALYNIGDFHGQSSPEIINCRFVNNRAEQGGGAVYNNGSLEGESKALFLNCHFEGNQTGNSGAGVYNNGLNGEASPILINCLFKDNHCDSYGGAMYNLGKSGASSPNFTNCVFIHNEGYAAGCVYNLGSEYGNSSPAFTNCTFYNNRAEIGACIYNQGGDSTGTSATHVSNSIFWGNVASFGEIFQNSYASPSIQYSMVQVANCAALNTGLNGSLECGDGLLFGRDPAFANPAADNLRLKETSVGIDMGSNAAIRFTGVAVDIDSLLRIWNGTVDLGAYEYNSDGYIAPSVVQQPVNQRVCQGESTSFEINAFGTRPFDFQWYKDGLAIEGATEKKLSLAAVGTVDQGHYSCRVVSLLADTAWSQDATLEVVETQVAELRITASQIDICAGEDVQFEAFSKNGGLAPTYTWYINAEAKATGVESFFRTIALQNGDVVRCQMRLTEACLLEEEVSSDSISVAVEALKIPRIEPVYDVERICEGDSLLATATFENGGDDPSFLWTRNEIFFASEEAAFWYKDLKNGDQLRCLLISNERCAAFDTVWSEVQEVVVDSLVQPTLKVVGPELYCQGDTVLFSAEAFVGDGIPTYEWLKNGAVVGQNLEEFVTDGLQEGDAITCRLTVDGECMANQAVVAPPILVSFDPSCITTSTVSEEKSKVHIYPNPAHQFVILEGVPAHWTMQLMDAYGRRVRTNVSTHSSSTRRRLDLSDKAVGIYLLVFSDGQKTFSYKITHL